MSESELSEYLEKLIEQNGGLPPEELQVFKKLVELTQKFRRKILAIHNKALTVRETQIAIAVYSKAIEEKRLPKNLDETIDELVKLWLKEINNVVY